MALYIVRKPHGGHAVGDRIELTRRQAEFLALGGFVAAAKPAPDEKSTRPMKQKKEPIK